MRLFALFGLGYLVFSCTVKEPRLVGIQPLGYYNSSVIDSVSESIKMTYGFRTVVLKNRTLPVQAHVDVKAPRYRADSLLNYLIRIKPDSVDYIMGLTDRDVSMTKRDLSGSIKKPESKYADWGVLGLSYRPGVSSVISTYRIQTTDNDKFIDRMKKICVHELGHNLGLKHCQTEKCVMQDAAEKISTVDGVELRLCERCDEKIN